MAKGPVLFVCIENAGRSQMAEAFARKYWLSALRAQALSLPLESIRSWSRGCLNVEKMFPPTIPRLPRLK